MLVFIFLFFLYKIFIYIVSPVIFLISNIRIAYCMETHLIYEPTPIL